MTLYTGVTNDLRLRVIEHKSGAGSEFTSRYHFDRLVYFETYDLIVDAINREKQIKGWTREEDRADQVGQPDVARFERRFVTPSS